MEWINKDKISVLAKEIGEENVPMLLDIFLGELISYVDNLQSISPKEKADYLREISHALKSSAASFGADRLCNKAIELDGQIKSGVEFNHDKACVDMIEFIQQTHHNYAQLLNH
jgi:two-component system, phosphorelay protein LuxU